MTIHIQIQAENIVKGAHLREECIILILLLINQQELSFFSYIF